MSRLSIRLRVVIASTVAMALVLVGLGLFVRDEVSGGLDGAVDRTLEGQVAEVSGSLRAGRSAAASVPAGEADDDAVAVQVLDRSGRVLAASPGLDPAPLLSGARLRDAADDDVTIPRGEIRVRDDDGGTDGFAARIRAAPVDDDRADLPIVVAATALEDHDATLRALDRALSLGLPIAALLAAALGWAVAAGALRPVEAMRRRAAGIDAPSDERLPVPPSRDEIARLGRTLNAMLDRQAEGFRRERAFAADASHELRTPLTILRTELDLAVRGDRGADELRAALISASEETRRLERLAEDLLVLARAEADRPEDAGSVRLRPLLEAVRDRTAAVFAADGRALEVVVEDGAPDAVEARVGDLDRALSGLVENALRHGAGATELRVDAPRDGAVVVHVLDRGPGVPDELRGRIFDRFVTGAGERQERRGTGLGLAIVAAVAEAHGGRVGVDDREGGGTDAWFSVPVRSRSGSTPEHGADPKRDRRRGRPDPRVPDRPHRAGRIRNGSPPARSAGLSSNTHAGLPRLGAPNDPLPGTAPERPGSSSENPDRGAPMIRTRTALTASAVAVVVAAGGTATALAVDRTATPSEAFSATVSPAGTPAAAATPRAARAGDDGLTHAQATKARRAALKAVSGRVASIERDNDRATTYDVKVLTKAGQAREVHLNGAFKVTRTTNDSRDGLTYTTLGRASAAATEQARGIVTGVDVEDEGRARYEVEVLTSASTERVVRLSSSYAVVTGGGDDDGDDD